MSKKLQKIGTICLNLILIIVIIITLIFAVAFVQMKKNNAKYVNIFGYTIMQVITGSMSDTINIKDVIIVEITKQVNKNDIITYEEGDNLITHRIVDIKGNLITTRGDANNANDKPITTEKVVGKVIKIIPKIGIWQKVLLSPQVIISAITTICLLYAVIKFKDKRKKNV